MAYEERFLFRLCSMKKEKPDRLSSHCRKPNSSLCWTIFNGQSVFTVENVWFLFDNKLVRFL